MHEFIVVPPLLTRPLVGRSTGGVASFQQSGELRGWHGTQREGTEPESQPDQPDQASRTPGHAGQQASSDRLRAAGYHHRREGAQGRAIRSGIDAVGSEPPTVLKQPQADGRKIGIGAHLRLCSVQYSERDVHSARCCQGGTRGVDRPIRADCRCEAEAVAQTGPNIHIDDITDLYVFLLHNPQHTGVYNAGFENLSIREIADMVCEIADAEIVVTPSNDPRSYRVNSDKLLSTGFRPKKTVRDAIEELSGLYAQGVLKNDPTFHNLTWMQQEVV